jgi:hypothetical protein
LKLFRKAADGGENSGVTGFFLIECKSLFSIVLLRFSKGSREAYHEHAFNAWTLWLRGRVVEEACDLNRYPTLRRKLWWPMDLKYTPRNLMHRIIAGPDGAWAISVRGPWLNRWRELREGRYVTLTHGRKEVNC